jgi:hypothetical protein
VPASHKDEPDHNGRLESPDIFSRRILNEKQSAATESNPVNRGLLSDFLVLFSHSHQANQMAIEISYYSHPQPETHFQKLGG